MSLSSEKQELLISLTKESTPIAKAFLHLITSYDTIEMEFKDLKKIVSGDKESEMEGLIEIMKAHNKRLTMLERFFIYGSGGFAFAIGLPIVLEKLKFYINFIK